MLLQKNLKYYKWEFYVIFLVYTKIYSKKFQKNVIVVCFLVLFVLN